VTRIQRGVAVPNFAEDPAELIEMGVAAEQAGFDGFFLWDHIVFSDSGDGPAIVDPWLVLAVVAARTSRIKLGTMITPVPRRRPWQLARQTTTLDVLSGGRLILGVGIGSPAYGDFGIFDEPTGARERADLLDEGLAVLAGLWTGERFAHAGEHFRVHPVRFQPRPLQQPRIPIWVGGVLPAARPIQRASRWDGMVPIRYSDDRLTRVSADDIADVRDRITVARGSIDGVDLVVWADVEPEPARLPQALVPYEQAGTTWWIESARPDEKGWQDGVRRRIAAGGV
jgi:alkanesulfonate monooxygenase SsuD/methylene tetrahydromethanopterin reductase-like flavin-dependent oxidoreductase (luciferase family)